MGDDLTTPSPWRPSALMSAQSPAALIMLTGPHRGRSFGLKRGEQMLGRDARADIRIDASGVSRQHAKVVWTPQGVVNLLDLRSTNGTAVNGTRVDVTVLRPGDRIQLGPEVELLFGHELPDADAERRDAAARSLRKLLSLRQLQVAKLVAEGLSNRDIGERLQISLRTVESHLDQIYARLDISSRSALTRAIVEAGLVSDRLSLSPH